MSDTGPALRQIGTLDTITNGDKPSPSFIDLWNLRLPLFVRRFVQAMIRDALSEQAFVRVYRDAADADHTAAVMVDSKPSVTPDAAYVDGLLIKSGGKKQLEQRSADSALVFYQQGDDTKATALAYDGATLRSDKALSFRPQTTITALAADGEFTIEATGNDRVKLILRGSDGVTRKSAVIVLT